MLSVILACDDPYEAADFFVKQLGWTLVFATPRDNPDKLACVSLGEARVMLGSADEEFLPEASRDHRGAGIDVYLSVEGDSDLDSVYRKHEEAGVVTRELSQRDWGRRAFNARILGYRFLFTEDAPD